MKNLKITVNGVSYDVQVEEAGAPSGAAPAVPPVPVSASPAPAPAAPAVSAVNGEVIPSPMPGTILDILVSVGQTIREGDVLFVLEAMKMENEIVSPRGGTITGILIDKGASVESGTPLASLA